MKSCQVIAENSLPFFAVILANIARRRKFLTEKGVFKLVLADRPVDISLKLILLDIMLKNRFFEMILCARICLIFHRSISIWNQRLSIIRGVFSRNPDGIG